LLLNFLFFFFGFRVFLLFIFLFICRHNRRLLFWLSIYYREDEDSDAEENEGGGRVMVEQGLFDKFPVEAIYGMHNWPGMAVGQFGVMKGPMMASFDIFEITVTGVGCHAAMPQRGIDPVVVAAEIVGALQTIASRTISPLDAAVVSVTQFHAGDTWNVIPEEAVLRGTVRTFKPAIQDHVEARLKRIAEGIATTHGCTVALRYERRYPATINSAAETEIAAGALDEVVGGANVLRDLSPTMGSEDFAFMLQQRPGNYIFLGNGIAADGSYAPVHTPKYDFNDRALPLGVRYFVALAQRELGA